jgi:hypothetical protein
MEIDDDHEGLGVEFPSEYSYFCSWPYLRLYEEIFINWQRTRSIMST